MTDNKKMAEFLSELRNRNEMPINEDEYNLLGEIADYLNSIPEAIEPVLDGGEFICGNCNNPVEHDYIDGINVFGQAICIHETHYYCPHCGRKVKWG